MKCPRCGAAAEGALCASCSESLAFAPPGVGIDAPPPAVPLEVAANSGWLTAAGVIQLLLGAGWLIVGFVGALVPLAPVVDKAREAYPGYDPQYLKTVLTVAWTFMVLVGVSTIVISSLVIARRRWAWIVSLVFDGLWVLLGLIALMAGIANTVSAFGGLIYIAIGGGLILLLWTGRTALKR